MNTSSNGGIFQASQPYLDLEVCQDGCAAIVDSGTSLIAAPASALMQLGHLIGEIKEVWKINQLGCFFANWGAGWMTWLVDIGMM